MNTNKTLGSNKQHSDRECLYKAEVTMTGKGTRFQEWMPVFFTVNILALLMPGYPVSLNVANWFQCSARFADAGDRRGRGNSGD